MEQEYVKLATLGHGAAADLFDAELSKVLENILDPNTPAKAKRSLTLKMTIAPDEDRSVGEVGITCNSKLVSPKTYATRIFMAKGPKGYVAMEHNPVQMRLDFEGSVKKEAEGETAPFPREVERD